MQYVETFGIITKKVLNENTGELETKRFREEKKYTQLRGGFSRMYKSYDEALLEVVKSSKDLECVLYVRDMFTYMRVECAISKHDIADAIGVSPQKATSVISAMVASGMLRRVSRGVYRLNPFMYLPFRSDGELLQSEWKSMQIDGEDK
jgi:hypothetical protein